MATDPRGFGEEAIEREEHAGNVLRLRKVAGVGLVAWPLFGLVDWFIVTFVQSGRLWFYWTLRGIGLVLIACAALRIFARPPPSPRMLRFLDTLVFTGASALISVSCLEFNGIASPLAMGVITVLVCRSAILSDHWRQGLLPAGLVALAHPAALAALAFFSPKVARQFTDPFLVTSFILNLLFIFGAAVITVAGGHAVWALRRRVFEARSLGRYRLKRRIGRGSMGEVWSAHHRNLKRDVAVKILRSDRVQDELVQARFEREIQATAGLMHPNTVRLFDYGVTDDGVCYFAMELLEGRDLGAIISREGRLPPGRAVHLIRQASLALAEAHALGVVHRDLKPANLFVTSAAGEVDLLKVLDFGLAKVGPSERRPSLTNEGWAVGTPHYISPEVLQGRAADPGSDIYALGAILYYLLAGRPPFDSEDLHEVMSAHLHQEPQPIEDLVEDPLPPKLGQIVTRCLKKDPTARYGSAMELATALGQVAAARQGLN
jgi:tRNA A-37 threonylcarbamoyl transferase component Bud32